MNDFTRMCPPSRGQEGVKLCRRQKIYYIPLTPFKGGRAEDKPLQRGRLKISPLQRGRAEDKPLQRGRAEDKPPSRREAYR
jgi:hypothetical protein